MNKSDLISMRQMTDKYVVNRNLPTIWCSGCGIGTVFASTMLAIENLGLDKKDVIFACGIGCSGYSSRYVAFDCVHTTHGRAIPVATGIKIAKPDKKIIVFTGDGDCLAIGGNHFIHAARRNIGMTVVLFNNNIYGMTGGQYSPATPELARTRTSPMGMVEGQFDACALALGAGASYIARCTTGNVRQMIRLIEGAISHEGFSLVDAVTQCPNQYGSLNKLGSAASMIRGYRERYGPDKEGLYKTGLLHSEKRPEYTRKYAELYFT